MPRPNQSEERRAELIGIVADAFAEVGYRRATTAELARRCGVQENILYRLWPDKRAMFIASLEHVFEVSARMWNGCLEGADGDSRTSAERLLSYESEHHGEFGLYRVIHAALSEGDDPEIGAALRRMYERYQAFVSERVVEHQAERGVGPLPPALVAWALMGVGTMAGVARELGMMSPDQLAEFWERVGRALLGES